MPSIEKCSFDSVQDKFLVMGGFGLYVIFGLFVIFFAFTVEIFVYLYSNLFVVPSNVAR